MNPRRAPPFARQSNLDIKRATSSRPTTGAMVYQLATCCGTAQLLQARCPRSARSSPHASSRRKAAATEFASARCAYPALPDELRRRVTAVAVHDFSWFARSGEARLLHGEGAAEYPPCAIRWWRRNPVTDARRSSWARTASISSACRWRTARPPQGAAGARDPAAILLPPRVAKKATYHLGQPLRTFTARRLSTPLATSA